MLITSAGANYKTITNLVWSSGIKRQQLKFFEAISSKLRVYGNSTLYLVGQTSGEEQDNNGKIRIPVYLCNLIMTRTVSIIEIYLALVEKFHK